MAQKTLFKVPGRSSRDEDKRMLKSLQNKPKSAGATISTGGGIMNVIAQAERLSQTVFAERKHELRSIVNYEDLVTLIDACIDNGICSLDTETTGLDRIEGQIAGVGLYTPCQLAAYVPVGHISPMTKMPVRGQLSKEKVAEQIQRLVDNDVKIVYHNSKFDMHIIYWMLGVEMNAPYFDTMIAAALLNENEPRSLKVLHQKYCGDPDDKAMKYSDLFEGLPFTQVPIDIAYMYAAHDPLITWELYEFQMSYLDGGKLCEERDLLRVRSVFWNIEMPLISTVFEMERRGVSIDLDLSEKLREKYTQDLRDALKNFDNEIEKYSEEIRQFRISNSAKADKLEDPINVASPTQVAILLYDILGLQSSEGGRGTGVDIIRAMNHPICDAILEYRKVDKLLSTYILAIPSQVRKRTGRLHCQFNTVGAKTGRFSSSEPNLQNIPSKNKDIRPMFSVNDGWAMVSADFSQQEPRILAHCSGDEHMIQAYREGRDLYAVVASKVYGTDYDSCREFWPDGTQNPEGKKRRNSVKAVLLGIMYGRGEKSIAEALNVSTKEAKSIIEDFFHEFPKVADYVVNTQEKARQTGFVETVAGRKRRLPDMQLDEYTFGVINASKNENFDPLDFDSDDSEIDVNYVPPHIIRKYSGILSRTYSFSRRREIYDKCAQEGYSVSDNRGKIADAQRQCVNSVIQGSAADMTKTAMILVSRDGVLKDLDFHLLIPVHDELIGECPKENAEAAGRRLSELMIKAGRSLIDVPQNCDVEITNCWYGKEMIFDVEEAG